MSRIKLEDNTMNVLSKMSEGNPGALSAMLECLADKGKTDPDAFMGGLGVLLSLDTLGIYGSSIYVLWSDICERDTIKFIAVIRAHQLGFIDQTTLKTAAGKQDYSGKDIINVTSLYTQVCKQLPNFDKDNRA